MGKTRLEQIADRMTADIMTVSIFAALGVISGHLVNMFIPAPVTLWSTVLAFVFVLAASTVLGKRWVKESDKAVSA